VVCLSRLAFVRWCLGYPESAAAASREALTYARSLGHPFSLAYALFWDGLLHSHLRDFATAGEDVQALMALCQEQRLTYWLPNAITLRGWAEAEQGEVNQGAASIQEGLEAFWATGARFQHPFFLSLLAEQMGRAGKSAPALALLAQARAEIEQTEERWCEAEIYRREGQLIDLQGDEPGAEQAFQLALTTARRQKAKMVELRAALGLAHAWKRRGRQGEVRAMLAPIYAWFSEGIHTLDLKEAQAFLD
jgi:predicted ATPase